MVTVVAVGITCSIAFHIGLREVHSDVEQTSTLVARRKLMEWYDWLKEHQFYLVILFLAYRTLAVPRTRTTLSDRSFAVAGPRVWNSLPAAVRQMDSLGSI